MKRKGIDKQRPEKRSKPDRLHEDFSRPTGKNVLNSRHKPSPNQPRPDNPPPDPDVSES